EVMSEPADGHLAFVFVPVGAAEAGDGAPRPPVAVDHGQGHQHVSAGAVLMEGDLVCRLPGPLPVDRVVVVDHMGHVASLLRTTHSAQLRYSARRLAALPASLLCAARGVLSYCEPCAASEGGTSSPGLRSKNPAGSSLKPMWVMGIT